MKTNLKAVILLAVFIIVWGVVGWLVVGINSKLGSLSEKTEERNTLNSRSSHALVLQALARDTASARSVLESAYDVDVVSAIRVVESTGRDAGVAISVESILSEEFPLAKGQSRPIPAMVLIVRGAGTFERVFRTLSLFENIPLVSILDSVQLDKREDGNWNITARIRIASESIEK